MKRPIAKWMIQYSIESKKSGDDYLSPWMRKWVNSDPQLIAYEAQLLKLERQLIDGADHYLASDQGQPRQSVVLRSHSMGAEIKSQRWKWAAAVGTLAASIALIGLVVVALGTSNQLKRDRQVAIAEARQKEQSQEQESEDRKKALLQAGLNVSKKLARNLMQSRGPSAVMGLDTANQSLLEEGQQLAATGRAGLRFFVVQVPTCAIKMFEPRDR
jgi:hypothetical protein